MWANLCLRARICWQSSDISHRSSTMSSSFSRFGPGDQSQSRGILFDDSDDDDDDGVKLKGNASVHAFNFSHWNLGLLSTDAAQPVQRPQPQLAEMTRGGGGQLQRSVRESVAVPALHRSAFLRVDLAFSFRETLVITTTVSGTEKSVWFLSLMFRKE